MSSSFTTGRERESLIGKTFGMLTVVEELEWDRHHQRRFKCICLCGGVKEIGHNNLRTIPNVNCGCQKPSKRVSLVGVTFGRLTVVEDDLNPNSKKRLLHCKCQCGKEKTLARNSLVFGGTLSCGCLKKETNFSRCSKGGRHSAILFEDLAINSIYGRIKHAAELKNRIFCLTKEQVKVLIDKPCYYCGAKGNNVFKASSKYGKTPITHKGKVYMYNGIDRVDSSVGYIVDNCVPCCSVCNTAKLNASVEDFKNYITRVYKYFILKEPLNE